MCLVSSGHSDRIRVFLILGKCVHLVGLLVDVSNKMISFNHPFGKKRTWVAWVPVSLCGMVDLELIYLFSPKVVLENIKLFKCCWLWMTARSLFWKRESFLGAVFLVVLAVASDTETEINKPTEIYYKMSCHLALGCMSYMWYSSKEKEFYSVYLSKLFDSCLNKTNNSVKMCNSHCC